MRRATTWTWHFVSIPINSSYNITLRGLFFCLLRKVWLPSADVGFILIKRGSSFVFPFHSHCIESHTLHPQNKRTSSIITMKQNGHRGVGKFFFFAVAFHSWINDGKKWLLASRRGISIFDFIFPINIKEYSWKRGSRRLLIFEC